MILVLIGRSGSGKTAIAKRLLKKYGYKTVRTATTRDRRDGETEDAYYFMTDEEFLERVKKEDFVEWDIYNGKNYGTLKSELSKEAKQVIVMTPEGAESIKKEFPDAFVVFIDVNLKTSVMRAISREKELNTGQLNKIAVRGCTDEYLYQKVKYDYICKNAKGTDLDIHVKNIADAHDDWNKKQKLEDML